MTIVWLVVAVLAIVAEMLTGTLYLLVIGIAAAAATALAWAEFGWVVQCVAASAVGVAGSLLVRRWRPDGGSRMGGMLGGAAEVVAVSSGGKLRVRWRGTEWDALGAEDLQVGDAVSIERQQGNLLEVVRRGA